MDASFTFLIYLYKVPRLAFSSGACQAFLRSTSSLSLTSIEIILLIASRVTTSKANLGGRVLNLEFHSSLIQDSNRVEGSVMYLTNNTLRNLPSSDKGAGGI
jgi:hypothetical protein